MRKKVALILATLKLLATPSIENNFHDINNSNVIIKNLIYNDRDKNRTIKNINDYIESLKRELSQSVSKKEYERIENKLLRLERELLALKIDDKFIKKIQKGLQKDNLRANIQRAIKQIEEYNKKRELKLQESMKKEANIIRYLASLFIEDDKYHKAKELYKRALRYDDSIKAKFDYAYFLQYFLKDYHEALKYYKELLDHFQNQVSNKRFNIYPQLAIILNNIAVLYSDLNQKQESLRHYREALKIRRALAAKNPSAYSIELARTLIVGYFITYDRNNLIEARKILSKEPFRDIYIAKKLL